MILIFLDFNFLSVITPNAYFSLPKHTKQIFLLTFWDVPVGIGSRLGQKQTETGRQDRQTYMEVEIVVKIRGHP